MTASSEESIKFVEKLPLIKDHGYGIIYKFGFEAGFIRQLKNSSDRGPQQSTVSRSLN